MNPYVKLALSLLPLAFAIGAFVPVAIWGERRIAGWVQSRIGPNRVGPFGLLQSLADALKLIVKEDIVPKAADAPLFKFAVYLVVASATASFVIVPFGPNWIGSNLDLGLLWYLAAGSAVTLGIVMAGWASNNKWSILGGARSAAQVISYEIAVGTALLPAVFVTGTLAPQKIVASQGAFPWQWNVFHNPALFMCMFFYFIAALAEINRTPFDLPEAESELVSGYNTEYSSFRWAMFMLGEYTDIYLICAITAAVFLGGWMHPWAMEWSSMAPTITEAWTFTKTHGLFTFDGGLTVYFANNLLGMSIMMAKSIFLVIIVILFRWTLPRLRVDQLMGVCWKYLVPLGLLSVFITAAWELWMPEYVTIFGVQHQVNYDAVLAADDTVRRMNANIAFWPLMLLALIPFVVAGRKNAKAGFKPAYGVSR